MNIYFNDTNNITKKYNLNSYFFMTPTTIFIIEKVVYEYNCDNEKVSIDILIYFVALFKG